MYQSRQKIQDLVLLLADMICFIISYFGGGYLWLVGYRNVSIENMKLELFDSFGIVLVVYMLVMVFSILRRTLSEEISIGTYGLQSRRVSYLFS